MDRVHHQLEGGIDEVPRFFGIKVFDESGGVFDIGKEGGNGFALTVRDTARLHCGLFSQDPFGQMLRRIADWGGG